MFSTYSIGVFNYLNRFNNVSPSGFTDYYLIDMTRNNENKLIVKRFNTSAQHFFIVNNTTNWNGLPNVVVNSRTVNTFNKRPDTHWEDNPPDVQVNW